MTATTITEESMEVTPHDLDDARKPPLSPLGILLMNFGFEPVQLRFATVGGEPDLHLHRSQTRKSYRC